MSVTVLLSYEERLAEVHRRLPVMLLQRDRDYRLNIRREPGIVFPLERIDQPLRFDYLKVFTALPQIEFLQYAIPNIEAIGMQAKPPLPSRPRIVFDISRLKLPRSSPMLHVFRIRPNLPHQLARSIEHPRNMQLMLRSHLW